MAILGPVITCRPEVEMRANLVAIANVLTVSDGPFAEQVRGVAVALHWVLGESTVAPISGETIIAPTWAQASMEADLADDAMRGDYPLPDGSAQFTNGVWIGISWAFGELDDLTIR